VDYHSTVVVLFDVLVVVSMCLMQLIFGGCYGCGVLVVNYFLFNEVILGSDCQGFKKKKKKFYSIIPSDVHI
jgi:hypothetical protein